MTTQSAAPTGQMTLPIQLIAFKNAPSGWAAVWPWTALLKAGAPPRFWAQTMTGRNCRTTTARRNAARIWERKLAKHEFILILPPDSALGLPHRRERK